MSNCSCRACIKRKRIREGQSTGLGFWIAFYLLSAVRRLGL
jgi:hypothetical protein